MKLLILLFILVQSSHALDCPKNRALKDIVNDLIMIDLEGVRYDDVSSKCLNQEQYKHALIVKDVSNDIAPSLKYLVEKQQDFKVLDIKLLDKDTHTYEVLVEFKVFDIEKKTRLTLKEKYTFFLYTDEVSRKNYGCFGSLSSPENIYLLKKCQK